MLPQSDGYGDFVMADFTGNGYVDIYVTRDATDNTPTDDVLLVNQ